MTVNSPSTPDVLVCRVKARQREAQDRRRHISAKLSKLAGSSAAFGEQLLVSSATSSGGILPIRVADATATLLAATSAAVPTSPSGACQDLRQLPLKLPPLRLPALRASIAPPRGRPGRYCKNIQHSRTLRRHRPHLRKRHARLRVHTRQARQSARAAQSRRCAAAPRRRSAPVIRWSRQVLRTCASGGLSASAGRCRDRVRRHWRVHRAVGGREGKELQ